MSSFCHIQDAYSDGHMNELDKMARAVNNKRKKNIKHVFNDYKEDEQKLKEGIKNLQGIPGFNFFSAQGDYSKYKMKEYDGTLIKDIHKSNKQNKLDSITLDSPNSDQDSKDSLSIDNSMPSDDSDFSSYSSNSSNSSNSMTVDYSINLDTLKEIKNKSKKRGRITDECMSCDSMSLDSFASEEDMIDHASKCSKCKKKILKILKNNKKRNLSNKKTIMHDNNDVSNVNYINESKDKDSTPISSLKEFIIICGIGLLVIFMLDFVLRTIRR